MSDDTQQLKNYIRANKRALRKQCDVVKTFTDIKAAMANEAEEIQQARARGEAVIPEVAYSDIASNQISNQTRATIRKRGCVIVRGVFPEGQARGWNDDIGQYLDDNHYHQHAQEKSGLDNYFGDLAANRPQIFGVYWSKPQVQARQAISMAQTKQFLNRLWDISGPIGDEFDPDFDYAYADRTRRRQPGDTTLGLSAHMDSGSYERWIDPAYQAIYGEVFSGNWQNYDPWRATYRTQTREYSSPAVCSMFRTFQGWTALTRQGEGDGTLRLLPVANAVSYVLLRSLHDDIPEDEYCIARPGRALGINADYHPELISAMVAIPTVNPGDTVWWHPDVIHAVENEHRGEEHASVIYIGASPKCAKNEAYARKQAAKFLTGKSAPDFAAEDYETHFTGRATIDDLSELGKQQMAIDLL